MFSCTAQKNDTSTHCVSFYLNFIDVFTTIFTNVLQIFKLFQQKYLLALGQNVCNVPLLVNDFHLFCDLFQFKLTSNSYLVAQNDFG